MTKALPIAKEWLHGLAHLLYPRLCAGCSSPLMQQEEVLCLVCLAELPRTGYHLLPDNAAALRFAGRIPYRQVTALAHFTPEGLMQALLHRLKYQNQPGIGIFLGKQLGLELARSTWIRSVDLLVPVPLHPRKQALRSYNQSQLIAAGISTVTGIPVAEKALVRVRHTASQTKKSREERVINVKDAFCAGPESARLQDCHVLLIDDVLTTGATLEAAALTLLEAPGLQVSIATAALAGA